MIKETAVLLLYVKALYATTYPMWVFTSYKYEPLSKLYNSNVGQKVVSNVQSRFPILFGATQWLYTTSESFAGSAVKFVKNSSIVDKNKYIGNYVRNICPQKLTRAFMHATVTCKLLFPVYCGVGYYLTTKTFERDNTKKVEY